MTVFYPNETVMTKVVFKLHLGFIQAPNLHTSKAK